MNLWDDTFNIKLCFNNPQRNEIDEVIETYKGSLKSAIRHYMKRYKHTHVTINFFNAKSEWIKEISW